MPLIFPSNPSTGQTYQSGSSATYVYNGEAWDVQSFGVVSVTSASFAATASSVTDSFIVLAPGNGVTTNSGITIDAGQVWQCDFFVTDPSRHPGAISMTAYRSGSFVAIRGINGTTPFTANSTNGNFTLTNPTYANTLSISNYQFTTNTLNLSPPGGVLLLKRLRG